MRRGYRIRGTVVAVPAQTPLRGRRVEAWDRDLFFDDVLGTATTDEAGHFEIRFDESYFAEGLFDRRPDVFFRVFEGEQCVLDTRGSLLVNLEEQDVVVTIRIRTPLQNVPAEPDLDLDPHRLEALRLVASRPPGSICREDPELFHSLVAVALGFVRNRLGAAFRSASEGLQAFVAGLPLTELTRGDLRVSDHLRAAFDAQTTPAEIRSEAGPWMRELDLAWTLDSVLQPDAPIRSNPTFARVLGRVDVDSVAALIGLDGESAARLADTGLVPSNLTSSHVERLVEAQLLNRGDAGRFAVHANLLQMVGQDTTVAAEVKSRSEAKLGRELESLADLASLTRADLVEAFSAASDRPAEESERDAARLASGIERLFPDASVRARIGEGSMVGHKPELLRLFDVNSERSLLATNTYAPQGMAALDYGDLSEDERGAALEELRSWQRVLRVSGGDVSRAEQLRVAGIDGALDLMMGPRGVGSAGSGIVTDAGDQARATSIALGTIAGAGIVLDWFRPRGPARPGGAGDDGAPDGEDSNHDTTPEPDPRLSDLPGFAHYFGNQDYCLCRHCQSILSGTAYFVDLMEFIDRFITVPNFGSPTPGPEHSLSLFRRRRDLWSALPLTCECTETLVPHLAIVNEILENYISGVSEPTPATDRESIRAAAHRTVYERGDAGAPELHGFAQPLSIPTARLDTYLASRQSSRAEVAEVVWPGWPDAARRIAVARLGLSEREYRLVAGETSNSTDSSFLEALYRLDIPDRNGVTVRVPATGTLESFDAQRLLEPMAVSRIELGELLATRYVAATETIEIRAERTPGSVQADVEAIRGLTAAALDRLHRFGRLSRSVQWSAEELDLVVEHLGVEPTQSLPAAEVGYLAAAGERWDLSPEDLAALIDRVPVRATKHNAQPLFDRVFNAQGLTPAETDRWDAASVAIPYRHPGTGDDTGPMTQRLLAALRIDDAALRALLGDASATVVLNHDVLSRWYQHVRLSTALGIRVEDLLRLFSLAGFDSSRRIDSVSVLESRLDAARKWIESDFSVQDLVDLTRTNGGDERDAELAGRLVSAVASRRSLTFAATVLALVPGFTEEMSRDVVELNTNGYSVPAAASATAVVIPPEVLSAPGMPSEEQLREAVAAFVAGHRLPAVAGFSTRKMAGLAGLSEQQIVAIADANPTVFVPLPTVFERVAGEPDRFRLHARYGPGSAVLVPPEWFEVDSLPSAAGVAEALAEFDISSVLPPALATLLGIQAGHLPPLLALIGVDLLDPITRSTVAQSFADGMPSTELIGLVARLGRIAKLFANPTWTDEAIEFVRTRSGPAPAMFQVANFNRLSLDDIAVVDTYRGLLANAGGDVSAVGDALDALASGLPLPEAVGSELDVALGFNAGTTRALVAASPPGASALTVLRSVVARGQLLHRLGISSEALSAAAEADPPAHTDAADALAAALRGAHDEQTWKRVVEPIEERVLEATRDALSDYVRNTMAPGQFRRPSDLYHWFLIDTEVQGCARTSKVVQANASLQLYVQRCLMRLERSADGTVTVDPADGAAAQWEWRKNYRVWEANRRVFLYPESYLLQSLRDDRTELFRGREEELLTREIDEQAARDTYASYLAGFAELADLKISGAFHDTSTGADTLHLFASNRGNPPDHFYRVIDNVLATDRGERRRITWGPWRKISVQIPVREVSPVVFLGRLFVFWVEVATRPDNDNASGRSRFVGYEHEFSLYFTSLRLDGTWTAPQPVELGVAASGRIHDRLADSLETAAFRSDFALGEDPTRLEEALSSLREQFQDDPERARVSISNGVGTFAAVAERLRHLFVPEHDGGASDPPAPEELHLESKKEYRLSGYRWARAYPSVKNRYVAGGELASSELFVSMQSRGLGGSADLAARRLDPLRSIGNRAAYDPRLYITESAGVPAVATGTARVLEQPFEYWQAETALQTDGGGFYPLDRGRVVIANAPSTISAQVINGRLSDAIVDPGSDPFYVHRYPTDEVYILKRLGTTLAGKLQRTLFERGVEHLLSADVQENHLSEAPVPFDFDGAADSLDDGFFNDAKSAVDAGVPNFTGPLGVYYREIFLHLPWRIAEHLNEQQEFAQAHRWFQYILDPTADTGEGAADDPKRIWRYVEFRRHGIKTLSEQLDDVSAIDVWERDPFNPHAVARVRLGAYMRGVWMKLCSNLLDWADHLFSRDTRESINEASQLYAMVADLLGPRPAQLGPCDEESEPGAHTYEALQSRMRTCSKVPLTTLEGLTSPPSPLEEAATSRRIGKGKVIDPELLDRLRRAFGRDSSDDGNDDRPGGALTDEVLDMPPERHEIEARSPGLGWSETPAATPDIIAALRSNMLRQACVFCIPPNPELLALWDRLEDRLYKIRNCMNIDGVRRALALFAPPIDPMLLVRARAAGLALEDVLGTTSGDLPPYRFSFLIGKAKEYASALQGFGAALLGAIERKDGEELARQKLVHERNILSLSARLKDQDVIVAEEQLVALQRKRDTILHRRDHHVTLLEEGLSGWEEGQLGTRHTANVLLGIAPALDLVAAMLHSIPKILGTASTTGGPEAVGALRLFAQGTKGLGELGQRIADSLSIEGSYHRRQQGWELQRDLANLELAEIDTQIAAAEIRVEMAERSREIHEKGREQLEQTFDYYQDKFTNLELYEWLSATLQRLYRQAYENAYSLLRLAEHAYRFERSDDTGPMTPGGYWEAGKAGLMAGEKLMAAVRDLERRFMDSNYRSMEIDQTFSLSQLTPQALIELKETGECEFTIPEAYFDLYYPGQYRRRIRSARLTIPSVTGPYTNVSATLTLLGSRIRMRPGEELQPVPPTRSVAIATSTGQNDAGVFRVDFRDERYMPFEGAGAVDSQWHLRLPKSFRPFDYSTINDVVLHLSYTAEYDRDYADQVEAATGSLMRFVTSTTLPRALSLRQEFSSAFNHLLHTPTSESAGATIELSERHFPMYLQGKVLQVERAWLLLSVNYDALRGDDGRVPTSLTYPTFAITRDDTSTGALTFDDTVAGLPAAAVTLPSTELDLRTDPVRLSLALLDAGDFAGEAGGVLPSNAIRDLVLYVEYVAAAV